jgi:uncharacterized protein
MVMHKFQDIFLVIKGFIILNLSMVLFTILVAELHIFLVPSVPNVTMLLLASTMAYICCIIYLYFQTKQVPAFSFNYKGILYLACGMVTMWLYHKISRQFITVNRSPVIDLMKYDNIYKYLNLVCAIILGPIAEECIYRGVFVKLLLTRGTLSALLLSSLFFVISHLFYYNYGLSFAMLLNAMYFFIFSIIAGVIYTQAGLVAAMLLHIFNNFYILVLKG